MTTPRSAQAGPGWSLIDDVGTIIRYQPQHLWDDGDFESWTNVGEPTVSKKVAQERMNLFVSVHPDCTPEKRRFLKLTTQKEVFDMAQEFPRAQPNQENAK